MTGAEREAADWVLAALTALVWSTTYALYFLRDAEGRRRARLAVWRLAHRMKWRGTRPRAVPQALAPRPPARVAPAVSPRPAPRRAGAASQAVAVSDPVRIAEWRADHLPLRYRLLGRVRRGVNDN